MLKSDKKSRKIVLAAYQSNSFYQHFELFDY